jgi:hypothetical protein
MTGRGYRNFIDRHGKSELSRARKPVTSSDRRLFPIAPCSGTNTASPARLRACAGLWTKLWTRLPTAVWPQISRK